MEEQYPPMSGIAYPLCLYTLCINCTLYTPRGDHYKQRWLRKKVDD